MVPSNSRDIIASMEFLKQRKRRSRVSDIAYIGLNLGLVVLLLFSVLSTQTPWLAMVFMLLSKWRIFAVRPRFWAANILTNTVDVIVGISHVLLLNAANGNLALQIALSLGFAVWLLLVKPRSSRLFVAAQAGAAVFVGTTALSLVAYNTDPAVFVLGMWVIGYSAARHVMLSYEDEPLAGFMSLLWGLVIAELGWLSYHWLFAYTLPNSANLKLVQVALVATLLSFLAERTLASHHRHGQARWVDLALPVAFVVGLTLVTVIFFSQVSPTGGL